MKQLSQKKLFLLDMDGTLYLGNRLFEGTIPFLEKVKEKGGQYIFLTNNSSRGAQGYVEKLARLGIEAQANEFLTSTEATVMYLEKNHPGVRFYVAGTDSFRRQLTDAGILITEEANDAVGGIILSNDTSLTFKKLDDICRLLTERDLPYIATNPDWVCPTEYGYVPDCGSFAEIIKTATGKSPVFIGKPEPEMVYLAMERAGKTKDETVLIGDRVYTDIASAYHAGVDSVLVLSGEGTVEDVEKSAEKPTWILRDISEVAERMD